MCTAVCVFLYQQYYWPLLFLQYFTENTHENLKLLQMMYFQISQDVLGKGLSDKKQSGQETKYYTTFVHTYVLYFTTGKK